MLPTFALLRRRMRAVVNDCAAQGRVIDGLADELDQLPDSYDAFAAFARRLAALPRRADWPYDEPADLPAIRAASDPRRERGSLGDVGTAEAEARAESAFLASVCGCILGKPLEIELTLAEIRAALEPVGEWPLADYLPERVVLGLRSLQGQWPELVRERIRHVAPDDDINYRIIGMLAIETRGIHFEREDLLRLWLYNLPVLATFGPERTQLLAAGIASLAEGDAGAAGDPALWSAGSNPGSELCGALIRADAYGYACPGRPELAAGLAWRDATMTHSGTGVYGAMFVAAAIAAAPVSAEPLTIFETALRYIPQRSRLAAAVADALTELSAASDWLDGYERIHARFGEFGHCRIYQELGTVMNTLRFAEDVGDGIAKQVSQGNDTDSFGATAGSILGAWFGPGRLAARWLEPFGDRIHTALALFHEQSLSAVAARMAALPARVASDLAPNP